jgi:hypothetical protein
MRRLFVSDDAPADVSPRVREPKGGSQVSQWLRQLDFVRASA